VAGKPAVLPLSFRAVVWSGLCALIVLAARALAYATAPRQSFGTARLRDQLGGPRLVIVALVALGVAAVTSAVVVTLARLAVRERRQLERRRLVHEPRLSLLRLVLRALGLLLASSLVFAVVESYLHWRAGLGWHGLRCVVGPVHRDALPLLAAFSLLGAALAAAGEHLLAWARRVFAVLFRRRPRRRPTVQRSWPSGAPRLRVLPLALAPGARAPPRA
jgi:hypothetical protein